MLALDILQELVRVKIVSLARGWGQEAVADTTRQVAAGIDGPRYARELYKLSQLLDLLGQLEQALKRVEEGLRMSGGDLDGLCLAGRYSQKLGRIQVAADYFRKALARQPGAGARRRDWAVFSSTRVIFSPPSNTCPPPLNWLRTPRPCSTSWAWPTRGRAHHDRAVSLLSRASELLPNEPAIHTNLALAEEQLGHLREAVFHYREALRLNPDDSKARAALVRLASGIPARTSGG